ncbi:MAG: hypothetical protein K0Q43_5656, partial [Ramlibacter sp.]|nr:hypothetical protein [Ramlibacter sp.]
SQENLQRKQVAAMLREWDRKHPGRVDNMFTALQNVVPSHLADGTHYDFKGLIANGVAREDGDKAFDPCSPAVPPATCWTTACSPSPASRGFRHSRLIASSGCLRNRHPAMKSWNQWLIQPCTKPGCAGTTRTHGTACKSARVFSPCCRLGPNLGTHGAGAALAGTITGSAMGLVSAPASPWNRPGITGKLPSSFANFLQTESYLKAAPRTTARGPATLPSSRRCSRPPCTVFRTRQPARES